MFWSVTWQTHIPVTTLIYTWLSIFDKCSSPHPQLALYCQLFTLQWNTLRLESAYFGTTKHVKLQLLDNEYFRCTAAVTMMQIRKLSKFSWKRGETRHTVRAGKPDSLDTIATGRGLINAEILRENSPPPSPFREQIKRFSFPVEFCTLCHSEIVTGNWERVSRCTIHPTFSTRTRSNCTLPGN